MYKLMIVDDEQIEREGMADFIPWDKYDVQLCGTAWNGVDALEKIQETEPDIVLTDIKMPVMNGIELISRISADYKDIAIIVLSGYGEFEYTSKAMEYGVRHYILKPCDEEKIVSVLDVVKQEIDTRRENRRKEKEYHTIKRELLPHAKEELLRRLMVDNSPSEEEKNLLKNDLPLRDGKMRLLAMKNDIAGFEYIEQFILGNILGEILKMEKMPLFTSIDDMVVFVIEDISDTVLRDAVKTTLQEFSRMKTRTIMSAVSCAGDMVQAKELYEQIIYLYALSDGADSDELLSYPEKEEDVEKSNYYFDFEHIRRAKSYDEILFEITLAIKKMQSKGFPDDKKQKICRAFVMTWKNYVGDKNVQVIDVSEIKSDNDFIKNMSKWVAQTMSLYLPDKEHERIQNILTIVYCNLGNTGLNIQYMAKNVLYMNEDYFGRVFIRTMKVKFSAYLELCRIEMAKRLLFYYPDMKIATLTELIGYPVDGQYFSKIFRKICGKTPTEYREQLKAQNK